MDARDLDDLVAVAQLGSFSAAARRRGAAISTVTRRIDSLEARLGLRLLDRRADGARLTPEGAQIAQLAAPLADQLARVARAAEALRVGAPPAPVRVTATEFVISDVLAPALPALWRDQPGVAIHLQSQPDVVSLAARDADLAVRMARPEGASLVVRRLAEIRLGLFAAPAYLDGRDPAALDLSRERLFSYDDSYGRIPELAWFQAHGLAGALAMRTASTRALLTAAQAGAGIALLPAPLARRAGGLIEVPVPDPLPVRTPWLAVHRDLRRLPHIRAAHRWIVATFAARMRG